MTGPVRDAGYDDFIDALETGSGYYLECSEGHGSLPPRRVCPQCGDRDLARRDLPEAGTILAHTVVHVPTPRFVDDVPYVTAIADFGSLRVTGQIVGTDPNTVENGATVVPDVGRTETDGDRLLTFEIV
ncbi:MAG: Zn-ribbon domain-containing OB-fold protein [Halanaeroarchaeum sp.]